MPARTPIKVAYRKRNPGKAGAVGGSGVAGAIILATHASPEWAAVLACLPAASGYAYTWVCNQGGIKGIFARVIG